MKGRRAILVLGVLLILASHPIQWYGTGGTGTPLMLDDYRVRVALTSIGQRSYNRRLLAQGELMRAWMSREGQGYQVNLTIMLDGNPWRASVAFSADDTPLENYTGLAGGLLFPLYLRKLGLALTLLWLIVGILAPRVFGRKCPDCPQSFVKPSLLELRESCVYTGGFDDDGDSLSPVARRDFVCPQCGYRAITYFVPGESRPAKVFRTHTSRSPLYLTPAQDELAQSVLDKWFDTNAKRTRFHTQAEWRAFYDELKASEHEERRAYTSPRNRNGAEGGI